MNNMADFTLNELEEIIQDLKIHFNRCDIPKDTKINAIFDINIEKDINERLFHWIYYSHDTKRIEHFIVDKRS